MTLQMSLTFEESQNRLDPDFLGLCTMCALCMYGTDSVSGSARGPLPLGGRDSQGGEEAGRGDHCHACGELKCRVAGAVCSGC